jgi:hypothetical protein
MKQNETNLGEKGEFGEKGEKTYYCDCCNYICCVKFSYDRHLTTSKHIKQSQITQNETNETNETKLETKKEKKTTDNICECGQIFYSRTTLWRHKKKCAVIETITEHDVKIVKATDNNELINYLIKENQ